MLAIPRSYLALEEWERAEEGLTKIVEVDKRFSPRKSPVWQKALGELAYVLYRQGKYAQAVPKWDELLRRPRALGRSRFSRLAITYSLGDSYRGIQSYDPKKRRVELTQAADCFDKVRQLAAEQPPEGKLELQMLRMSYLGEADCLYQLEHFERALDAYRVTAGKYPERVEGLSALFGMAACYRRMGPASGTAATLAVKRALWTLEKVKREHPTRVTPFHETCWTGLETGSLR